MPFLLSKEFSSDQENNPYGMKNSADGFCNSATAEMHQARWSTMFDQMDKALSEEEKQLVSIVPEIQCFIHSFGNILKTKYMNSA